MDSVIQFGHSVWTNGCAVGAWCKKNQLACLVGSSVAITGSIAVVCRSTDPKVIASCVAKWSTTKALPFITETLFPAGCAFVSFIGRSLYTNGSVTRVGSGLIGSVVVIVALVALDSPYTPEQAKTPSTPLPSPQETHLNRRIAELQTQLQQATEELNQTAARTTELENLQTQLQQVTKAHDQAVTLATQAAAKITELETQASRAEQESDLEAVEDQLPDGNPVLEKTLSSAQEQLKKQERVFQQSKAEAEAKAFATRLARELNVSPEYRMGGQILGKIAYSGLTINGNKVDGNVLINCIFTQLYEGSAGRLMLEDAKTTGLFRPTVAELIEKSLEQVQQTPENTTKHDD